MPNAHAAPTATVRDLTMTTARSGSRPEGSTLHAYDSQLTRRRFLATTTASTAMVAMPYVRGAHAAGKLTVGLWDHWVPGANATSTRLIEEWAAKEKVEVQIDYITTQGNKLLLTEQAEALAKTRPRHHDLPMLGPGRSRQASRAGRRRHGALIKQNGAANATAVYLGKSAGHWAGGAGDARQQRQRAVLAHRPHEAACRHRRAGHVSGRRLRRKRTAGRSMPFSRRPRRATRPASRSGSGLVRRPIWSIAPARSSMPSAPRLVDAKGNITVKTDAVRQALEYYVRLARFFPADAPAWDDASNNKILVSGKSALILNPPSAWAVAKRDAPKIAEQLWTHGMPAGPKGRFTPCIPYFWGIWSFGKNKSAAKSLLMHLSQPAAIEKMVAASQASTFPPSPT